MKTLKLLILVGALVLVACGVEEAEHKEDIKDFELGVHATEDRLDENPNVILLDVRQPEEYEEEHIDGSLLLPLGEISQQNLEGVGLQKDDEIILYCRSGTRSAKAYQLLTAMGYTNVKSLGGGIIHWKEDGMSVVAGAYDGPTVKKVTVANENGPAAVQVEDEFDFGEITQFGGTVSHTFSVRNDGKEDLIIGDISTSCGCTTAEIDVTTIASGELGTITVVFDPDLHEEPPDRFSRTVFVPTNDPNNEELEYRIWVDILEGE